MRKAEVGLELRDMARASFPSLHDIARKQQELGPNNGRNSQDVVTLLTPVGWTHFELGEVKQALHCFEELLQVQPRNWKGRWKASKYYNWTF